MMYCCGPHYIDEQGQDNKLEPTYSTSVPIRNVVLKTCRKQWTIEKSGEKGPGISEPMARYEDYIYIYIYMHVYTLWEKQRKRD